MPRALTVAGLAFLVCVPWASAGPRKDTHAADAPRLLSQALRDGNAPPEAWAAIVSWVLTEKQEKVAAGLAEALAAMPPPAASGPDAERWNATARAVVRAFEGVLDDARDHRRRGGDAIALDLAAIAGPAIAAALSEADPEAREGVAQSLRALAPAAREIAPDLRRALRSREAAVRRGAATVLGALGPEARAAIPDLQALGDDPDPGVRDAAARALKQIQPD